ncbi:uncharacterized protein LOC133198381 [Saccostrea echinata]|uniref:uncharacterized protein LOC133198381 n=1 Tax=Saccostrea echinata TaxID=191078 RepID=UPI002A8222A8|nr:uncharacterized protein LOC133198381 [Saccostrea echinata]
MEKIRDKGGRFISKGKQSKITSIKCNRQKNVAVEVPSTNSLADPDDPLPIPNDDFQNPIHILEHNYAYDLSIYGDCEEEVVPVLIDDEDTSHVIEWNTGRRIVELEFIVNKLIEGCCKCKQSLNLRDICGEQRYGLGSLLHIKCTFCTTGCSMQALARKKLSMLLSVLNIPPLSKTSLKTSEREVGRAVEDVAKKSCKEFANAEQESFCNDDFSVSFDGGWQKRGSGRSYSSLSEHAAMIGKETGKCIAYATRNKFCRVCERAERTKKISLNISAGIMGMMKELQDSNIHIGNIIMDNDSTTVARARADINPALKKQSSPLTYKPWQLPYHRYLNNQDLKSDLTSLLSLYTSQADKLVDLGSTQPNESLNNTIASKTPKQNFYSGSESNDFRVAAAIAQKNWVNEVFLLSPGEITSSKARKIDLKRKRTKETEDTSTYKKKRAQKKMDQHKSQESAEVREGRTYEPDTDMNNNTDPNSIKEIPPPLRKPVPTPITEGQYTFVYFDLETTGLGDNCEITQIGASVVNDDVFCQYVLPLTQPISASATAVSGIATQNGCMYKNGHEVQCMRTPDAVNNFIHWLGKFGKVLLVAHNAKFDSRVLVHVLSSIGISASEHISGFVDTLSLLRELYPGRKSYKQVDLLKDLCVTHYDAHDAKSDALALQTLLLSLSVSCQIMMKHSFSIDNSVGNVVDNLNFLMMKMRNMQSLQNLIDNKILSKFTVNKIAETALHFQHILLAYQRDKENGVRTQLSEKTAGKPRVTGN